MYICINNSLHASGNMRNLQGFFLRFIFHEVY